MKDKNSLYLPAAIVLAGFFIGLGIYMTGPKGEGTNTTKKAEIVLKAIDKTDNLTGDPDAPIKIVEFSDTECPFCKRFHTTMHGIMDTYGKDGKVAWVYRHFPLDSLHKKARKEAEAAECANELGGNTAFWSVLDAIYTNTNSNDSLDQNKLPEFAKTAGLDFTKFNECLSSGRMAKQVEAEYQDGLKAGVRGTPHSIIVLNKNLKSSVEAKLNTLIQNNGLSQNIIIADKKIVLNGALPLELIKSILDIIIE
jgi:protein-disulfide isomerase